MRYLLLFTHLLFLAVSSTVAQTADTLRNWGASLGVQPGRVLVVDDYQGKWQKDKSNFSLDASWIHVDLPTDSDAFAADYGWPELGVGLKMSFNHGITMHKSASPEWGLAEEVDYDSHMGNSLAAYVSFNRPFFRGRKWMVDYSLAAGVGYSHSAYHPRYAVDNELIGSHWLIYFGAGVHVLYHFNHEWGVKVGADFWHLSNGALSRPNKGANIFGPSASIVYCPYYDHLYLSKNKFQAKRFAPSLFINLSLGVGAKTLNEDWLETQFNTPKGHPDYRTGHFKLYMAYSLQADVMYRYARRWASGAGVDVFYGSYADRVRQIDGMHHYEAQHSPWSLGVALKHHVYYKRIALAMSLG